MKKNNSNVKNKILDNLIKTSKIWDKRNNRFEIVIKNKEKGWEGVAALTNDGQIRVYEGNKDGSDDNDYNYEEFCDKYKVIGIEIEANEEELEC